MFLSQELDICAGTSPLDQKIADALIIWALRDTDPDRRVFMTQDQILAAIVEVLPSARSIVSRALTRRLKELSSKNHPEGRQINAYRTEGTYCLPFSTRETVQAENATDLLLRETVSSGFADRAASAAKDREFTHIDASAVAAVCMATIEKSFEEQGLAITRSISDTGDAEIGPLPEIMAERVRELGLGGDQALRTADIALRVIRAAFYASTEAERRLFNRWSRTYALLFSVQNEPHIVEWMRQSATRFHLYIGSDVIIRALSERFLRKEDRLGSNALDILAAAGATLVLTEPVLEEILELAGFVGTVFRLR